MQLGADGTMREIAPEDLCKLGQKPLINADEPANSGSDDEAS